MVANMSENEEHSEFKVVDKRRFSSDGESLTGNISEAAKVSEPVQVKAKTENSGKQNSNKEQEGLNFSSFVLGIYTHTLIFLGDIPHPETNEVSMNLDAAKQNIDILTILEEKTKGNLTSEEAHLMKEVLDMLRLQFIGKK